MSKYIQEGLSESKKGEAGATPTSGSSIDPAVAETLLLRVSSLNISADCLARVRDILGRIVNGKTVSDAEIEFVLTVESNPNCSPTATQAGMPWWIWLAVGGAALFLLMGDNKK